MRFIDEIIDSIRAALGPGYPISVRICGDEMTPDVPGTLTLADGLLMGEHLEKKGIDVINISNGSALNGNANCDPYSYAPGWKKHVAKAFKERLSIPVIATNTIKDPQFAEELLDEGVCDFVGLGRSQMADPEFMRKTREGRADEIRGCIGCMFCRERLLVHCNSLACAVNPRMGREYILGDFRRDGAGRPVVVAGGGPAGMEAARVLAERGFKVTLFEKDAKLGGTLNLADKPPHKNLITRLVGSMTVALERLGVDVRLGVEATPALVRAISPVGVFVAAGATPIIPPLPGVDLEGVHTAESVISGESSPSGRVVIVGTGLTGLETAEILLNAGCAVTLVEMQNELGPGLFAVIRNDIMGRVKKRAPMILTGHRLTEIQSVGGALRVAARNDTAEVALEADSVVLALGVRPRADVVGAFEDEFGAASVFAIGDASKGGRIYEAMRDGFDRAFVFDPPRSNR
jgi:NADPH-dependent 2,4-dienoyl-CoA reductase/sulfur reductase-like enzyme